MGTSFPRALAAGPGFQAVRELGVFGGSTAADLAEMVVGAAMPRLERLVLTSPREDGDDVTAGAMILRAGRPMRNVGGRPIDLAAFSRALAGRPLQRPGFRLVLEGFEVDAGAIAEFVSQPAVKALTGLSLAFVDVTPAAIAALAKGELSLEQLELHPGTAGPEGTRALVGATWFGGLRELQLGNHGIDDESGEALVHALASGPTEVVDLSNNRLGPRTASALATAALRSLRSLSVLSSDIDDAGMAAILNNQTLSGLEVLEVGKAGGAMSHALLSATHLTSLKTVRGYRPSTSSIAELLKEVHPALEWD